MFLAAFCNLSREGWPTKSKMAASKLRNHHHLRYFLCTTSFSWFNLDDPEATTHAACSRPWPCCVLLYCEATTWFRGKSFFFLLFLLWLPFSTTFLYSMMIFVPVPSYRYFLFHILFFIRKLIIHVFSEQWWWWSDDIDESTTRIERSACDNCWILAIVSTEAG